MKTKLTAYLTNVWLSWDARLKWVITLAIILMLFGDTLLPIIGHTLFLLVEVIELLLEHWLEAVFHLTTRQSQLLMFWLSLFPLTYATCRIYCKAYIFTLNLNAKLRRKWFERQEFKHTRGFKLILVLSSLGISLVLFS